MLRRVVPATTSSFGSLAATTRRWNSDGSSIDGSNSGNNNPDANLAGRIMCDTTDGVYAAMMMTGATAAGCASKKNTATQSSRSIFGDTPAAVATSLMGCLFFGTTYGYYIGGAVKEAALGKLTAEE